MKKIWSLLLCISTIMHGAASSSSDQEVSPEDVVSQAQASSSGSSENFYSEILQKITVVKMHPSASQDVILKQAILSEGILKIWAQGIDLWGYGGEKGFELATFETVDCGKKTTHAISAVALGNDAWDRCSAFVISLAGTLLSRNPEIHEVCQYFKQEVTNMNTTYPLIKGMIRQGAVEPLTKMTVMLIYKGFIFSGTGYKNEARISAVPDIPHLYMAPGSKPVHERGSSGMLSISWNPKGFRSKITGCSLLNNLCVKDSAGEAEPVEPVAEEAEPDECECECSSCSSEECDECGCYRRTDIFLHFLKLGSKLPM